jgi:hypothetical protein
MPCAIRTSPLVKSKVDSARRDGMSSSNCVTARLHGTPKNLSVFYFRDAERQGEGTGRIEDARELEKSE